MSKYETPMTRWYWEQVRGTLVEEFYAVSGQSDRGKRLLDAIIIHGGEHQIIRGRDFDRERIRGQDITIVQSKAERLGMYLMGQALFSRALMEPFQPKSILSVAVCSKDDALLRPILEAHEGLKVVICPATIVPPRVRRKPGIQG